MLSLAVSAAACGGGGIAGAWVQCDDIACTAFNDDGALLTEDGFAFSIDVDDSKGIDDASYCVHVEIQALAWTLNGDQLTVTAPGQRPETGTAVVDGDRLTFSKDMDTQLMQRIDEDQKTGACKRRVVVANAGGA